MLAMELLFLVPSTIAHLASTIGTKDNFFCVKCLNCLECGFSSRYIPKKMLCSFSSLLFYGGDNHCERVVVWYKPSVKTRSVWNCTLLELLFFMMN